MLPLKKQSIIPRIDGIERDVKKLKGLSELKLEKFQEEDNFALSQFYLRRALEGVFHIGNHLLSRLSGGRSTQYKEIAKALGEKEIVDRSFAENNLVKMAGYRNRLTHFYADISPEELYKVLNNDLGDFDFFLTAIIDDSILFLILFSIFRTYTTSLRYLHYCMSQNKNL